MTALVRAVPWLGSWNYDVGVRLYPVARTIREADPARRWSVLDIGSGGAGLRAFLPGRSVMGLDLSLVPGSRPTAPFALGNAAALPFRERTWDVVACVDVLEHIDVESRAAVVKELVRVSRQLVILAFPSGPGATLADQTMARDLEGSGADVPQWLREHQLHPLPGWESVEGILRDSSQIRTVAHVDTTFRESLSLQRIHRGLSHMSPLAYKAFSLLCALAVPYLCRALPRERSYRCTVVARTS